MKVHNDCSKAFVGVVAAVAIVVSVIVIVVVVVVSHPCSFLFGSKLIVSFSFWPNCKSHLVHSLDF